RRDVPGFDQAAEIDLHDKPTGLTCHRNPNARNFWLGLAEDYLRSYDVDGLRWGSERQGPLDNALGASHGSSSAGGVIACFCPQCLAAARQEGINIERARDGYLALERWAAALRAGQRPADGAFVTFWRLLVKYPELLAWERLWNEGLSDTYRDLYRLAKSVAPAKGVGWHIWHNNAFSLLYRVARDQARGRGRRAARQDLARDRHRHPYGAGREEDPARGRVPGGARGVPGGRSRRAAVAEVLGDEAREHPRRGAGGARAETGMTIDSQLLLRSRHSGNASQRN